MKHIIHLITTIENGGAEKQLMILASEQVRLGNKVKVMYLKGRPDLRDQMMAQGIEVCSSIANKNFLKQIFLAKYYLMKNVGPNVILHAHLPRAEILGFFAKSNRDLFITRHNSESFFPKEPNCLGPVMSRIVLSKSSACIAISDAVGDFIIDNSEIDRNTPLIKIYYGYMPKYLQKSYKPDQRSSDNLVVGTISRLEKQKDLPCLLRAISLLKKNGDRIELRIAGSGTMKNELENLCLDLGIQDCVYWLGKIDPVDEFLANIDIFVLSTKYEGFGLVLLEAMQAKLPIIASNNSSIPEVLGSENSKLFATGDEVELSRLILDLKNHSKRKSLGKKQSKRLLNFNPTEMANKVLNTYDSFAKL